MLQHRRSGCFSRTNAGRSRRRRCSGGRHITSGLCSPRTCRTNISRYIPASRHPRLDLGTLYGRHVQVPRPARSPSLVGLLRSPGWLTVRTAMVSNSPLCCCSYMRPLRSLTSPTLSALVSFAIPVTRFLDLSAILGTRFSALSFWLLGLVSEENAGVTNGAGVASNRATLFNNAGADVKQYRTMKTEVRIRTKQTHGTPNSTVQARGTRGNGQQVDILFG